MLGVLEGDASDARSDSPASAFFARLAGLALGLVSSSESERGGATRFAGLFEAASGRD